MRFALARREEKTAVAGRCQRAIMKGSQGATTGARVGADGEDNGLEELRNASEAITLRSSKETNLLSWERGHALADWVREAPQAVF
jgi:hypothetical protein